METELRLIEQRGAEGVSVSERKVPQPIIRQPGKTWRWRAAKIRGRQRLILCAIGQKEPTYKLAPVSVHVIQINNELVFIKLSRDAERRESAQCESFSQIDCLWRWNRV